MKRDHAALARAFLRAWAVCGLATAVDACRMHGVEGQLRGLGVEQFARAAAELEYRVKLVRGL